MKTNTCAYCEQERDTRIWKETGESVCYDCRMDLLDQEFDTRRYTDNDIQYDDYSLGLF